MSELLDIKSEQSSEIVQQFGSNLIQFGIFSDNVEYFFNSFKILLKCQVTEDFFNCYEVIFQVAKDSFTLFLDHPPYIVQFWARMSNFHFSYENDRELALIAIEFLSNLNVAISDESSQIKYDPKISEVFIYYLCRHIDVLFEEDEVQLLLNSYIKLMKFLLTNTVTNVKEDISKSMKFFYLNCSSEQLKFSVSFIMYKINKYVFPENREDQSQNYENDDDVGTLLMKTDDYNTIINHYFMASYLFIDMISYHPKAALPYIESHFIPLIEKLIEYSIDIDLFDLFSCFVSSSICNEIDYYDFFDKILENLFNEGYDVRLGCYDIIRSFGTYMNYLAGFIFPILIQNIGDVQPNEFIKYLNCLYVTFNPSLTFSEENSSNLYAFFESLLQNQDDEIRLEASLCVFKFMIMHSHIFAPLFPASLEVLVDNPDDDDTYYAFQQYIKYFGLNEIEELVDDFFSAVNNYLDNEGRFMCVATLLKYVPETRKTDKAEQFYKSIVFDNDLNLGEISNLDMVSHVIFIDNYFVHFFANIHRRIRNLNMPRKDLLYAYCKISRKMLKHIPERANVEDIARVVDSSFNFFLNMNIELISQMNGEENQNSEIGIENLLEDTKFIIQNSNILAEFGIMLSMLGIDKVHIVTEMFLNLATSGDYEVLLYAMIFFEKILEYEQASEEEINQLVQFSALALECIRVDIHLNQLINIISALPHEIIISQLWGNLIEFLSTVLPSAKDFQCTISSLAALMVNLMSKYDNLFDCQIASECLNHFPPYEKKKTMIFLNGIILFATNDFPIELKSKANECILEYLSWNPNRTKFYKVSEEMDSFIVSNFSE